MKVKVKLNDQRFPVIAEVIKHDMEGITFSFCGTTTLGNKVFDGRFVVKRYLNKEFEVIYDDLVS